MAGPADRTVLLLHRPVPYASAVEDMPAFQHYRILSFEIFQADSAGDILTLNEERFIGLIDLTLHFVINNVVLITLIDPHIRILILIDLSRGDWRVGRIPTLFQKIDKEYVDWNEDRNKDYEDSSLGL